MERAIDVVEIALQLFHGPIYVRKEIVHNKHVVEELKAKGAIFVEELDEVPDGARVIFSAHGVSPEVRRQAKERKLQVIDATCPLVTKVHVEARRYARAGRTIFLIGHRDHVEVIGTRGEAPEHIVVVGDVAEAGPRAAAEITTRPGKDAVGGIQEIGGILEADPDTDWSKVRLEALRQHLIDMNEVTLHAAAAATPIDGGLAIAVTGQGRTLAAIQRMVPAHAPMIDGHDGWHATATLLPDGARLTVTASDPREVAHIRGLGFIGLMATGAHHQAHHLAIAEGQRPMHTY